ncbi:MAG: FAD-dependent oxidoreductase [Candidatus Omnitrophota bacterium]
MQIYDLVIIGAGPAGITAAVYAARQNLNFIVISRDIGGQTALSAEVENYTGYQVISGPELVQRFEKHMHKYNINLRENESVLNLKRNGENFLIKTDKAEYLANCVIIASGKQSEQLNVLGEQEFKNRGLAYCAICDGPIFAGKNVAVIGGGNSALDAASILIKVAKHVYIINNAENLKGDQLLRQKIEQSANVTILNKSQVLAVAGDKFVKSIKIKNNGQEQELAVEGVFVEIGLVPNSEFAEEVKRNQKKEIMVDIHNQTNIAGIFAAGDVTDVPEKQIIIAAGEGSKAALGAFGYLARKKTGNK